jgi:hypothetical protein
MGNLTTWWECLSCGRTGPQSDFNIIHDPEAENGENCDIECPKCASHNTEDIGLKPTATTPEEQVVLGEVLNAQAWRNWPSAKETLELLAEKGYSVLRTPASLVVGETVRLATRTNLTELLKWLKQGDVAASRAAVRAMLQEGQGHA